MRKPMLVVAAYVVAGCYNYAPVTTAEPQPGTQLAFTLTESGSRDLARSLGTEAFVVRGRYLGESDEGMIVSVSSVETKRGYEFPWAGEKITLPDNAVAGMETRQLAKGKSLLLVGAGVTGLVAVTAEFLIVGNGTRPGSATTTPVKQ